MVLPMPTLQLVSELDLDQVLDGMAHLELGDLEQFAFAVNHLVAQRKAPSLPKREAELLQQLNRGLPHFVRQRYALLHEKLLEESLSPAEHSELSNLIDQIEQFDAQRLELLVELAQLRGVDLDFLMAQLGLTTA